MVRQNSVVFGHGKWSNFPGSNPGVHINIYIYIYKLYIYIYIDIYIYI